MGLDAAAWRGYFKSRALEQQEAAACKNGTRKPNAPIANKTHLSVSVLLAYVNICQGAKGRDAMTVKRKSYMAMVKGLSLSAKAYSLQAKRAIQLWYLT